MFEDWGRDQGLNVEGFRDEDLRSSVIALHLRDLVLANTVKSSKSPKCWVMGQDV